MIRDFDALLDLINQADTVEERSRLRKECSEIVMQSFLEKLPADDNVKQAWLHKDLGYKVGEELFLRLNPADDNFLVQRNDSTSFYLDNIYREDGYWRVNRIWLRTNELTAAKKANQTLYSEQGMKVRVIAIRPELCNLITEYLVIYP